MYASTRADELETTGWTDEQKEAFLRMQFDAQSTDWDRNYPDASREVVMLGGVAAGRLYVDRRPGEIRIVDIALLPEHRGCGAGTALLREVLAEAEEEGKPVGIHVERFNPARRLYERLGFAEREDRGVYVLMEWRPGAAVA